MLFRFVHGRVGNALDHEVRRYTRRRRFYDTTVPAFPIEETVPARQEEAAEFRGLVEHARRTLDPVRQRVFEAMMFGDEDVEGVSARKFRRLKTEIRKSIREYAAA